MDLTGEETEDLERLVNQIARKLGISPVDAYKVFVHLLEEQKGRLPADDEYEQVSRCVK
jgi:hypothetical protein